MATILSTIPEGVLRVLSRSVGNPYGIAENAIEGAIGGAILGGIAQRLAPDSKHTPKQAMKAGAKLGATHGALGKILSRIPGEAIREKVTDGGSAFKRMLYAGDSPGTRHLSEFMQSDLNRRLNPLNKGMEKAEKVVRSVYTYNRVKTAIRERLEREKKTRKIHHTIGIEE